MSKGVVLHLENDKKLLDGYAGLFKDANIDLEFVPCLNETAFNEQADKLKGKVKSVIFDLVGEKASDEELAGKPEFLNAIKRNFNDYNLPMFIYTARPDLVPDEYKANGTVLVVSKDSKVQVIFDRIQLYLESGFIEIFRPQGLLETQLHLDLNKAFRQQFSNSNHIPDVISLIKGTSISGEEFTNRVKRVFTRIAVRSLMTDLLSPELDENGKIKEETVGITEHYVRRINKEKVGIWTGDIFKKNDSEERFFVLMPRCNALRCDDYLVCPFNLGVKPQEYKPAKYDKMLTGDPKVSGYERYLPGSPIYSGGEVALSKFYMKSKKEIESSFDLEISISDELTNEILGKFAAYFFRTGITPWNTDEGKEFNKTQNLVKK